MAHRMCSMSPWLNWHFMFSKYQYQCFLPSHSLWSNCTVPSSAAATDIGGDVNSSKGDIGPPQQLFIATVIPPLLPCKHVTTAGAPVMTCKLLFSVHWQKRSRSFGGKFMWQFCSQMALNNKELIYQYRPLWNQIHHNLFSTYIKIKKSL